MNVPKLPSVTVSAANTASPASGSTTSSLPPVVNTVSSFTAPVSASGVDGVTTAPSSLPLMVTVTVCSVPSAVVTVNSRLRGSLASVSAWTSAEPLFSS